MSLTGDPNGPPYRAGISVFDVMAGLHATIGVLSALHHRSETGRGQHIEVNLLSSALSAMVNHSSAYVAGGVVPYRMGNSHPSLFPYEPLPCSDGDLIITAGNDGQFRRLCDVLGLTGAQRRSAFCAQSGPHRESRAAPPAAGRATGPADEGRVVRRHHRGRRALRPDQHDRSGCCLRQRHRPRSGGRGRCGRRDRSRPSATRSPFPRRARTTGWLHLALDEQGTELRAWLTSDTAPAPGQQQESA